MSDWIDLDSFAGGGGASTGLRDALEKPVDIAINHSDAAIAMHAANHPETRHYCESIWTVSPREATRGKRVRVAWFSPDCFPAGTMVLTDHGYRAIESIQVGDVVLTHRQRWRRVTETHSAEKPLVEIRGHGHPGIRVSSEHPFYARQRRTRHRGYSFDPPSWQAASSLERGWYWSAPTTIPALPIPAMARRSGKATALDVDARLMWLAGRYVGDGWTRLTDTRAELVIICGKSEAPELRQRLEMWPRAGRRVRSGELAWASREVRTAVQFTANSRALVEWLRGNFGHGGAHKSLPAWLYGAPEDLRCAFLDGYLSADGWSGNDWKGKELVEATTVSPALAWSLRTLLSTLGIAATVYRRDTQHATIEGRHVAVRPAYQVRWRAAVEANHAQTFVDDGLRWSPVRERRDIDGTHRVFNIAVDDDESYIADGVVVHNCTHFSRAKGGKPRDKNVRGLAGVVIDWARDVRPRVIILENVREFQDWGPLDENGFPIAARKGEDFRAWLAKLSQYYPSIDFRCLRADRYGAPTSRDRFYLVARLDGQRVVWPEYTHGEGTPRPVRTAAEIIDWSLDCPSIFGRKRPLAEATLRRIAAGLKRYVIESPEPFIVPVKSWGGGGNGPRGIGESLRTVTAWKRGEHALVTPYVAPVTHTTSGDRTHRADASLPVITTAKGGEFALISPFLSKYHGGDERNLARGQVLDEALRTLDTENRFALVARTLIQTGYGERKGQKPRAPGLHKPVGTTVNGQKHALVAAFVEKFYGTARGADACAPLPSVTAHGNHLAEVRAFLVKYYGDSDTQKQPVDRPLDTATTKARFGLVMVHGMPFQIVDIGLRMLQPRELFSANGFPDDYKIDIVFQGKRMTKTTQIELVGNSVCPPVARALAGANVHERWEG